jgi:amino acid adenylation domain-containing protein
MGTPHVLHDLLTRSAEASPDALAIVDGERRLTYAELDARSSRLANLLVEVGVVRGDRVAIYLDKSIEAVVSIYAALKAGACYVPLDPRAPLARLAYIGSDCGTRVVCTGIEKASAWAGLIAAGAPFEHIIVTNAADVPPSDRPSAPVVVLTSDDVDARPSTPPPTHPCELDLAYILYTSGSTGQPKGVMLTHRNALAFVEWVIDEIEVVPADRLSSHAPLHFDLSVLDLFAAAAAGASVWLVPAAASVFPSGVARFIREHSLTVWYSVPSVLSMMTDRGGVVDGDFADLRVLLFAGEVFPTRFLRQLMERLPHVRFGNLYGPTETNVCTAYWVPEPPAVVDGDIPIGRAIANVETFVVDDDGLVVPDGEIGELIVRGPTVARGYWNDPERTARRFVVDSRAVPPGDLVYRTGDLVRKLPSGDYRFLGRRDNQIKSRGHRIELGEIETALSSHEGVVEVVAVAVADEMVTNKIKVCVVLQPGTDERDVLRQCNDMLPKYMVPDIVEVWDALPKTSTGKIDRQAIAAGPSRTTVPGDTA